ncbi:MAG: NAD(P)/FAD-dependent oxidoreductase [Candidatus Bathyarchaeota archaeon]
MDVDAIIVGAGPIGSTVATIIAKAGHDVLILEEHSEIGLPEHCTGKISINAVKELNLPNIGVKNKVNGATFYSPDMNYIRVERKSIQAHIFDRTILDQWLLDKAINAGAILLKNARVMNVSINLNKVLVHFRHRGETHHIVSKIVVGADGAGSSIARHLNLYSKELLAHRIAVQRELINIHNLKPELVEIYLGKNFAPGFFAWIVPTGENSVKVGLGIDPAQNKNLLNYLENFVTSHPIAGKKLAGGICTRQTAHILPTHGTLNRTVSDGVLIVGDAAGQVKSTTGGGLYYGMVCAKIAGEVISKTLFSSDNIVREAALVEYQKRWRERFGKEIEMSIKTRLILDSLTDEELNLLFNVIRQDEALIGVVEATGDIDWQSRLSILVFSRLTSALVKKPKLLLKLGKLFLGV